MVIVETIALSTMVCNDLVMPVLLRMRAAAAQRAQRPVRRCCSASGAARSCCILLLGYLYFRLAGEAYALVSIGLISFAAVAQFAPAILGGIFWKGGTRARRARGPARRLRGLALHAAAAGASRARAGCRSASSSTGPFGIELLKPLELFGLAGLDQITHA